MNTGKLRKSSFVTLLLPLLLTAVLLVGCDGGTTVPEAQVNPEFFGAEVVDEAVVEIGAIEGFLVDGEGEIQFAIVRTLTNRLVLVDPARFELAFEEPFDTETVVYSGSAAELEEAPAVAPELLFDDDPAVEPVDIGVDTTRSTLFVVRET